MVFTKRLREGIRRGRIRCSIRIWQSPRVKAGGRYRMDDGHIVVDSIAPKRAFVGKHVVHIIFAADLSGRSLERVNSTDAAVRGHRLFDSSELDSIVLHPPLQRFLGRWQPGDPAVYLGALWAP